MAVAFGSVVNVVPGTGTNTGASPSITTSATNPVVIVHVALQSTSATSVSSLTITGFGGTAVEVKNVLAGTDEVVSIWAIKSPTPSTSGTVQANLTANLNYQMAVLAYSGADQTDPCPTGDAVTDTGTADVTLTPTNLTANDATSGSNANTAAQDCDTPTPTSRFVNNTSSVNQAVGENTGTGGVTLGGSGALVTAKAAVRIKAATTVTVAPTPQFTVGITHIVQSSRMVGY